MMTKAISGAFYASVCIFFVMFREEILLKSNAGRTGFRNCATRSFSAAEKESG